MADGLERLQELEKEGFSVTKIQETPEGGAKIILTNIAQGLKKVVQLSPEEKQRYEKRT